MTTEPQVYKNLVLEKVPPGIAVLKISRPKALNALNSETLQEMEDALRQLSQDESVRIVVLTGDGEKAFIAGADIAEMKDKTSSEAVRFAQLGHAVTNLLETMPKPVIAAVNGFALGGGTEMAIACDFILCSEKAVFGQPEVGIGVIPGFGANFRLARFVGSAMAKELIYTGRKVPAQEAKSLGLVNQVFPPETFMGSVLEIAKQISNQSLAAISRAKQLLTEFSESSGINFKLDAETQAFGLLFGTHDQLEGMSAFLEKRKPRFQGIQNDL